MYWDVIFKRFCFVHPIGNNHIVYNIILDSLKSRLPMRGPASFSVLMAPLAAGVA